jgi:branched-chain amino acid transport system ATP-binding protein
VSVEQLIAVRDIHVLYKGMIRALNGVSLTVAKGQVVAILGANGAGKTTTLRATSGFIGLDAARVTKGTIAFKGVRVENRPPHHSARLGIALVPERDKIFPNLTVIENLLVPPSRLAQAERRRMHELVFQSFPALARRRTSEAGLLSGGERQMLGIAAKLVAGPELLLLDELSLGLAPVVVQQLMTQLMQIKAELRLALLIVEQNASLALQAADHAYVLENGAIVLEGDAASLRSNAKVHEFYLGVASTNRPNYRSARTERMARLQNG